MRSTFIKTLEEAASHDDSIFLISADMGYSILEGFAARFPRRFLNVGIAEQNAVSVAAGLAMSGFKVYVYSIIPFVTMRCFEQIRVDVAYQNVDVRLVGVGAGFSYGPAGATHHAFEDISVMRTLPNMTVVCPGDPLEAKALTLASVGHRGPMYIRLGKNGEPRIHHAEAKIQLGRVTEITPGSDFTLFVTSNLLETAAQLAARFRSRGVGMKVLSAHTLKPFDKEAVAKEIRLGKPIISLEEHSVIGGLGTCVAEVIAELGIPARFLKIGIPDEYTHFVGSHQYLRSKYGLDLESLEARVTNWL